MKNRIEEMVTGAVGDAAGVTADPRQGVQRLKSTLVRPTVIAVGLALVAGYLLGRWRR
ncbi:hypothetical protein [Plantactinospora sp. KLBMP9567]|uniref:hypothetical protein n=1 Tax=Plantactinospora sp. KLBMP9567 TaxID=3085900 RepID=UPI0029827017|nr:hypothetical protein [Plantactinospora sp. KLBMP9567]MDW5328910.1 hypothetical protein [Plantactinospora sp. KLBMP9567]